MAEKTIETADLQKALSALQDLAKGHNSRGTATTEVVGMTGETGPTQLFHTPSNSDPGSHAGSKFESEDWSDMIDANGTDLKVKGRAMAKSIMDKLTKGQALTKSEVDFVAKGGLDKFGKDEAVEKSADHGDEAEDKKMMKEELKPAAFKGKVEKSLLDHAAEEPQVANDLEVSKFLAGFASVIHKSLQSAESRITTRVSAEAEKQASMQKSLAEALSSLGEVLALQQQRIEQLESSPARAPKSVMAKSVASPMDPQTDDLSNMSKGAISEKLIDLMQKGQVSQMDVLRYDASGELSREVARKVAAK